MIATTINKGLTIFTISLAFMAILYALFATHFLQNQVGINTLTKHPVLQTGGTLKAFDHVQPFTQNKNKTPEQLHAATRQIVIVTRKITPRLGRGLSFG